MRWLFRLFFLERFFWPASEPSRPVPVQIIEEEGPYKTELECLVWFLQGQLQERVYYNLDTKGRVIIGTAGETIATLAPFSKAGGESTYIAVHLEGGYDMHKAWFQLAFVCFKVRFRKPTLTLSKISGGPPRGH